jgi:hypothetical protein
VSSGIRSAVIVPPAGVTAPSTTPAASTVPWTDSHQCAQPVLGYTRRMRA